MKLFIWNEPYEVSYGGSCLYVLAHDLNEAREVAKTAVVAMYGDPWNKERILGDAPLGEPSRVIEQPYGEVYHWAE